MQYEIPYLCQPRLIVNTHNAMLVDPELSSAGLGHLTSSPKIETDFLPDILSSGAITEDITDIDEEPKIDASNHKNTLMSLLSGKQNSKKKLRKGKALKSKVAREDDPEKAEMAGVSGTEMGPEHAAAIEFKLDTIDPDLERNNTTTLTEELSEVADTSFDAVEFERKLQNQRTLAELERKVFKESKSISALDFLRRERKLKIEEEVIEQFVEHEELSENEAMRVLAEVPEIEIVDEIRVENDPIKLLEEKFASKRTAAKDLFSSFAPKRLKNSKGEWTLKVKLRIDPLKLAAIKEFENPLKTKGTQSHGAATTSLMSALMRRKESLKVTLKVSPLVLKDVERNSNPLYTKSSGNQNGKPAKSVFAMMMQTASQSAYPKLTPIQKLKELQPPIILKELLHVTPQEKFHYSRESFKNLKLNAHKPQLSAFSHQDTMDSLLINHHNSQTPSIKTRISNLEPDLVANRAPLAFTNSAHERIYKDYILHTKDEPDTLNWPQKFQPPNLEALLLTSQNRRFLQLWFDNAFAILSTQSTKVPRNVKMREQAKRQKKREAALGFIVDDDYDDGEETEEDTFVPVLIIFGETGSCKSSSVYAALNDKNGYVYEINAGQQRSRRDLYGSLKEFCTTQIIHQNLTTEVTTSRKGVVLFEDCDILFEQDKTFWTVVQDVINFSKRPIVITVTDPSAIPRNIWDLAGEQNSIIELQNTDKTSFEQYLWLCAYSFGYDISPGLQGQILAECKVENNYDLRLALMKYQWLCQPKRASPDSIVKLDIEDSDLSQNADADDLESLANNLDLLSISDVIASNTSSSILHDCHTNELLDIYVIHDCEITDQPTLPHELNIGDDLRHSLQLRHLDFPSLYYSHNQLREIVNDFISSRKKKLPRFLQDLGMRATTRSRSSSEQVEEIPETQQLPETSTCYSMSPYSFALDLAPIARLWSRFQKTILAMDLKYEQEGQNVNLELFLGWRRFYYNVEKILETSPLKSY